MEKMTEKIKEDCLQIKESMNSDRMKIIFTSMKKIHTRDYLKLKLMNPVDLLAQQYKEDLEDGVLELTQIPADLKAF